MYHRFHLFLLLLASGTNSISSYQDVPSSEKSSCKDIPQTNVGKLKKAVFCGYSPSDRPVVHHTNKTTVKFLPYPTHISWIMEDRNSVYMGFWIYMQWQDDLLLWNTSDYGGLGEFFSEPGKIWSPDIIVSDPPQPSSVSRQMNCVVNYKGSVECTTTAGVLAQCNFDLKYFPYDRHSCRAVFQPQFYKGSELDLDLNNITSGLDTLKFYRSHGTWNLLSPKFTRVISQISNEIHIISAEFTFEIERQSYAYSMMCTIPAFVVIMMTLSVFWLDIQSSARVILPALTILSEVMLIQWLMSTTHSNLNHTPLIILFFQDSLLLTGLSLFWSTMSRAVCSSSFSPHWLHMISNNLNKSNFIRLLLPQDIFLKTGASGDEDESSLVVHRDCVEQQWRILVTLGDRILFGLYILIFMYFFMWLTP